MLRPKTEEYDEVIVPENIDLELALDRDNRCAPGGLATGSSAITG